MATSCVRLRKAWLREFVGSEIRFVVSDPYLIDPSLIPKCDAAIVRAVSDVHQV
jgi:hypothetical protein